MKNLFLILFITPIISQAQMIEIVVKDSINNEPLEFVNIGIIKNGDQYTLHLNYFLSAIFILKKAVKINGKNYMEP